jgi:sporulation protein YtfJ
MSETKMSDIIRASLDGIRDMTDMEAAIGDAITTPNGVTVIPVSKVTMGIATGGIDYATKKLTSPQNFGGGGGTGMTITPIAFLTVSPNAEVGVIPISSADNDIDKLVRLVDRSPDIISKIKGILS